MWWCLAQSEKLLVFLVRQYVLLLNFKFQFLHALEMAVYKFAVVKLYLNAVWVIV